MSVRVLPYRQGSQGARNLAEALRGRCLRLQGSTYRGRFGDAIVNWGNTTVPEYRPGVTVLNGTGIREVSNKLLFFQRVRARDPDIIPEFWTNPRDIPDDSFPIVCRTVLAGHSGEGIVIVEEREDLVPAPLYVRYVKKMDEYRIHVGKDARGQGSIIDVQQKKRRQDHENVNNRIRNHHNGWIYAREGIELPDACRDFAIRALACSDLDFGAVDVIYNRRREQAYVLEVNTAPGITGTTVERYKDYFVNRLRLTV